MPGIKNTLSEFKSGELHSGSKNGPIVKNRKQAVAIALSEERAAGKKIPQPRHPHSGRYVAHSSSFGYASNPPGSRTTQ